MTTIYPRAIPCIRDTANPVVIDDNDPEFIREGTGLFAIYYGVHPPILLQATENDNEWDFVTRVYAYHFDKLSRLFRDAEQAYHPTQASRGLSRSDHATTKGDIDGLARMSTRNSP